MKKKLYKSRKNKVIGGVCGGIAEYFNIDPTIVRIITVILGFIHGFGVAAYLIIFLIMPYSDSEDFFEDDDINKMKSANVNTDEAEKSESPIEDGAHSDEEFDQYFKK